MNSLIDKVLILTLCILLYAFAFAESSMVVPILIVVSISAFHSYFEHVVVRLTGFTVFFLLCLLVPSYIVFFPLICYDFFTFRFKWLWLVSIVPIAVHLLTNPRSASLLTVLVFCFAYFIKSRSDNLMRLKKDYILLRDNAKELHLSLQNKNNELLEKQDYEITVATLKERNRIAKDIHDHVGHTLSSAILQAGAVIATAPDEKTKQSVSVLKDTLISGMESIRSSIHGLHNESIDLKVELESLARSFDFCALELEYDMDSSPLSIKVKYSFLFVVKEALANIIRHSNATKARIRAVEHPAIYQLVIEDNGTEAGPKNSDGIGLKNIRERIEGLGGIVHIREENGFMLFISVPKEEKQ